MKNLLSKTVTTLALGACLFGTSCIGPNNAYNSVKSWNSTLTENKLINELAFLGLHIIPVYPLAVFGDYIVLNSWEFWTGENLLKAPEDFKPQGDL
ncbi:MAG: DUF3332 family protein [Planctomycetota bacterium]